jgi:phosphomannomutase
MNTNWKALKSGSDIRGLGVACGGGPLYLSDEVVGRIAAAFAEWLSIKTGRRQGLLSLSVGHDPRISSVRIKNAVINAAAGVGANVFDCGMSSTPAMFMTTLDLKCDGAIQITASHHPMDKNGLKFFTADGGLEGSDISDILQRAEKGGFSPVGGGNVKTVDYMKSYAERLKGIIRAGVSSADCEKPLSGFKIAVDAGNGAGGFYANDVLEPLGADISGSVFLEPDGTFPNHIPNPEDKTAMRFAAEATVGSGSDLGIIFDTDVDRAGCVAADGTEINRNRLAAVASYIALKDEPGAVIVTDSVTSDGLAKYIASIGGVHLRFKRGYKNIINKQTELVKSGVRCPLAIETSGHASFADNYFLDDGAYLMTKIVILAAKLKSEGKTLRDIISSLSIPAQEMEVRIKINSSDFKAAGERFIEGWAHFASARGYVEAADNHEGIRLSADGNINGWILARLSVHDPVIVINAESDLPGGAVKMLKSLYDFAKTADDFDISSLAEIVGGS